MWYYAEPLSQLLISSIKKLVLVKSSPTLCSLETICRSKKEKARVSTTKNELNSVGLLFFTDRYLDCRQNEFLRIRKKRHLKTKYEHKKALFFFGEKNLTIPFFFVQIGEEQKKILFNIFLTVLIFLLHGLEWCGIPIKTSFLLDWVFQQLLRARESRN